MYIKTDYSINCLFVGNICGMKPTFENVMTLREIKFQSIIYLGAKLLQALK